MPGVLIDSRRQFVTCSLLSLLLSFPFLSKAVHIDDPVVLAASERILVDPWDPYSGDFDWFGHRLPFWQVTTNPPLLSYYLAPWVSVFGCQEIWLHLAMVPFLVMMAFSMFRLSRHWADGSWWPVLFLLTSPAVWVSMNLMRDVPATALLLASLVGLLEGSARGNRKQLAMASLLAGAAALTKYTAAVVFPIWALYALSRRRAGLLLWTIPGVLLIIAWCGLTAWQYGWIHPLFLLAGLHPENSFPAIDKMFALLTITGSSMLLLVPWLGSRVSSSSRWVAFVAGMVAALAAAGYHRELDLEYLFWAFSGAAVLWLTLGEGLKRLRGGLLGDGSTTLLLTVWPIAILIFGVVGIKFQAVRHLLPALPAIILLAFRLHGKESRTRPQSRLLMLLLMLQLALGGAVAWADRQYADCYRDLARGARAKWQPYSDRIWFVGHWGWQFYARKAGFSQLSRGGPLPETGDIFLQPIRVHIGNALEGSQLGARLELMETRSCSSDLPLRTVNHGGAAFYAVVRNNLPFRFQTLPLEELRVYRVKPPEAEP